MKVGDMVTYRSSIYRWLFVGEEEEGELDLKLSGIQIKKDELCLIIDIRKHFGNQNMVKLLTPQGIGWITTEWLGAV